MAAGRDIKRETIRIRREQARKNAEAVREAEERRSAMGQAKPSDSRRRSKILPPSKTRNVRSGHRIDVHSISQLERVAFASPKAKELAEEANMTLEQFEEFEATSENGFTAGDVRDIVTYFEELAEIEAAKKAEEEEASAAAEGEETDEDEEMDEDEDEEKMADEHENKMLDLEQEDK